MLRITNQHAFRGNNGRKQLLISHGLKALEDGEEAAVEEVAASLAAATAANEIRAGDAILFQTTGCIFRWKREQRTPSECYF